VGSTLRKWAGFEKSILEVSTTFKILLEVCFSYEQSSEEWMTSSKFTGPIPSIQVVERNVSVNYTIDRVTTPASNKHRQTSSLLLSDIRASPAVVRESEMNKKPNQEPQDQVIILSAYIHIFEGILEVIWNKSFNIT